jgi:predicted flavoprotein YhiN
VLPAVAGPRDHRAVLSPTAAPAPVTRATAARHVAVVGAGAAGLTAAIRAAEAGARVTLLNAHPRIGLKILMSGGTRCNVTHREVSERDYNGGSRPFVRRILAAFTPKQTIQWFDDMGVNLKLEETGKYFPETDDAQTVLDALLATLTRAEVGVTSGAGVSVEVGARVVRLERGQAARVVEPESAASGASGSPWRLGIQSMPDSAAFGGDVRAHGGDEWPLPDAAPERWIEADAVILATGGLSFPRTGSDGTGYALAAALGHTLVPPSPALTPLVANDPLCASCQGVTVPIEMTLRVGGAKVATVAGSFLFTHFGYSGPVALDLSRHWLRAEDEGVRRVTASFVPGWTREKLLRDWLAYVASDPQRTVRRHLRTWLPERLANELASEVGLDARRTIAQVTKEARDALFARLVARDMPVTGTLGYEKAEVTAGGVALDEVNPSTLESRMAPGVHLCGEILDVEGRLGGFNFQWSWSSGTVAGRAAAHM